MIFDEFNCLSAPVLCGQIQLINNSLSYQIVYPQNLSESAAIFGKFPDLPSSFFC